MAEVEEKVDDVTVVTENGTEVKVMEAKEGIMSKIGKHKKIIIGAAIAGGAIIAAKVLRTFRSGSDDQADDTGFDDDFDEFDSETDTSDSTETE